MTWEADLQAAPGDPEAAARVLGHVAAFIRRGEVLPGALAEHIAGAFEDAERQIDRRKRADVLANDLFLFGREGRPRAGNIDPERVGINVAFGDRSQRAEWAALAARHGVSVGTIRNRYNEWVASLSAQQHEGEPPPDPYDQGVQKRN